MILKYLLDYIFVPCTNLYIPERPCRKLYKIYQFIIRLKVETPPELSRAGLPFSAYNFMAPSGSPQLAEAVSSKIRFCLLLTVYCRLLELQMI